MIDLFSAIFRSIHGTEPQKSVSAIFRDCVQTKIISTEFSQYTSIPKKSHNHEPIFVLMFLRITCTKWITLTRKSYVESKQKSIAKCGVLHLD